MRSARRTAYDVLLQVFKDQAYSNLTLDHTLGQSGLSRQDKAFAARLVYGTVERMMTLDYILARFLTQPIAKLKLQVLVNLRLAAYQIVYMEKVPASAAINEAVKLAKETGCAFASGLVNAVLRKVAGQPVDLSGADWATQYSCPEPLIQMWKKMYGKTNTEALLETLNAPAPLTVRVNPLKITPTAFCRLLEAEGIGVEPTCLRNAFHLHYAGSITELPQFSQGLFHVQDLSSQLCVEALEPVAGETVLDLCAAPGGKSFTIAECMQNSGVVFAMDIYSHRLSLLEQGAIRLGIKNIKTAVYDASVFQPEIAPADRVLCDVPCSGLGIIRRKPEIRYKELDSIKELPALQLKILTNASRYVKPGGTLVYSTCALNRKENNKVVDAFLKENTAFASVPVLTELPHGTQDGDYMTLFPHINGTDGFFIAKLVKRGSDF